MSVIVNKCDDIASVIIFARAYQVAAEVVQEDPAAEDRAVKKFPLYLFRARTMAMEIINLAMKREMVSVHKKLAKRKVKFPNKQIESF